MRPLTLTGNPSRSPRTPTRVPNKPAPASIAVRPTNSAHVAHASDPVTAGPSAPVDVPVLVMGIAPELLTADAVLLSVGDLGTVGSCAAVTGGIVRPGFTRRPGLWTRPAFWNTGPREASMSSVQSVERAFTVLRCLAGGPAGVSEVAERSHLPKSTVSRLLSTLNELGAVDQLGAGGDYRIGDLMVELAAAAQPGRSLVAIARPHLVQLREALGEATGLSVLDGHDVLYLDQVEADHPVQVRDWTGERLPAHLVSSGLVLLAGASAAVLDEFLSGTLPRATARTVTDPELIRRPRRRRSSPGQRLGVRGVRRGPQLGGRARARRGRPGGGGRPCSRSVVPLPRSW